MLILYQHRWRRLLSTSLLILAAIYASAASAQTFNQTQISGQDSSIQIRVDGKRMTLSVRDVALSEIFQAIAHETGLVVYLHDNFDQRTSLDVEDLHLPEVLGRLLRDYNFALHYVLPESDLHSNHPQSTSRLWVYSDSGVVAQSEKKFGIPVRVIQPIAEPTIGVEKVSAQERYASEYQLALFEQNRETRLDAIDALADMRVIDAAVTLALALGDQDVFVREQAVDALMSHGDSVSVQLLEQALNDADATVRSTAINALGEIGGQESVRALGLALQNHDPVTREDAIYALANIGSDSAVRFIERGLEDRNPSVRLSAVEFLMSTHNDATSAAVLAKIVDDKNPIVREEVVYALGEIGGEEAIKLLQHAVNDKNKSIATLAQETLNLISN